MTPERRQEVGERLKLYKSGTPCKPQAAFAEVLRLFGETLADNDSLTADNATLRTRLDALVTAGEGKNYQTPDTVGGFRYLLVYDSGDTWEDVGYCYSREADRIMDRNEAEKQFSTRPAEERPELYALIPIKQYDALAAAVREAKGEPNTGRRIDGKELSK